MAELAIPLVVLGGLYVVSNQDKKEKFENMEKCDDNLCNNINDLPNARVIPQNYPTTADVSKSNIKRYPNANQTTDKFFDSNIYQKTADQKMKDSPNDDNGIYSLTGDVLDRGEFQHNNMVPFFGSKVKGATIDANTSESFLDNMQGTGSQQIKKRECAPLFAPEDNMQWNSGMPSTSDFFQSRVNPSTRMSNIKPWEEIKVAPGLGKGFTTQGGIGFNTGMEAREQWMPKNVDQLRVETNPKVTFGMQGHEGPATSYIKNSATQETQGAVEKYLPDTYFNSGPERWLTTTGIEKGETLRSIEMLQDVNRTSTTQSYYGSGGSDGAATYITGKHEPAHRTQAMPCVITNVTATGQQGFADTDYGKQSYANAPNNRCTTSNPNDFGFIGGVMKAALAPIIDVLRPTRKDNVIDNIRPQGNINGGQKAPPVYNPADRTSTTNREMFADALDCNHLNVQKQTTSGYQVANHIPVSNQRDGTTCSYTGDAMGEARARTYDAEYKQRNNNNKIQSNRISAGGTQMFNQNENICIGKKDSDRYNTRGNISVGGPTVTTSGESYGKVHMPQYYNESTNNDRIQPDILSAFKNNPYTQSLNSWA